MLPQAVKASQTVTAEGDLILPELIDGVRVKEVRSVVARNGVVTEAWRAEWLGAETRPNHVVYCTLAAQGVSNWHCHQHQNDLLMVVRGLVQVSMYDPRPESPTRGMLNRLAVSGVRPTLFYIPANVWHALKNLAGDEAAYLTMNSAAFDYANPDDWKLPPGDPALPPPF
jgi:dTDP-4-dehydrorhamnose 3,5-epimerase